MGFMVWWIYDLCTSYKLASTWFGAPNPCLNLLIEEFKASGLIVGWLPKMFDRFIFVPDYFEDTG